MKRLVYVLTSAQVGGMEQHTLDLVTGMVARDFKVWVVCPAGPMVARFKAAGATVVLDYPRLDIDLFYIRRLAKFCRENHVDIIHGHELKAGLNALIVGWLAKTPLKIIHVHTPLSQWQIPVWKKKLNILVYRFIVNRLADKVIALTPSIKEIRVREEGIRSEKVVVIPNGSVMVGGVTLNAVPLQHDDGPLIIGYFSRMTEEKGFSVLLKGFEIFLQGWCDKPLEEWPRLLLGGDGHLRESLQKESQDLGLARFVTFTGMVTEEKKLGFLQSLDVFVFPTLAEGFGLVLVEAMAAGKPCLVSDLPVLRDVAGDAAVFFKTGDAEDLAEKLLKLYEDALLRQDLSQKGQERVAQNFTLEKFWQAYENLYNGKL